MRRSFPLVMALILVGGFGLMCALTWFVLGLALYGSPP